jgi:uncharacterized protein DUF5916/cellulose/xylan binding protein with CBM9 domain
MGCSKVTTRTRCISNQLKIASLTIILVTGLITVCSTAAQATFAGFHTTEIADLEDSPQKADHNCPSLSAYAIPADERVEIDGRLDDPVWRQAASGCDFKIWDPDRGSPASQETIFKVAYDEDAIYFAIACLEDDPANIAACLSRRDDFVNSDMVSVYIDPYHDKSTGYNFKVNPLGVQNDSYMFNDGDSDRNWNAVWQAETFRDDDGWYTEMRIPFSSIRYRQDAPTWGLQVYRYMHSRGEDTAWVVWDRETAGFVSRFGSLSGLTGIPAPRQLEILPYAVYQATDISSPDEEELDTFQNMGLDMKYGVTADLTMNATIQPDFGQVESDPATLNLSPFETYFSERRPFFVEGNRFFSHPEFNMFYSRRIGTGDQNSRIRYATKLTGKTAGDVSVAALIASTDITENGQSHNLFKKGVQSTHYMIGRFGKEFSEGQHQINVMQTAVFKDASRDDYGNRASREGYTTGLDFKSMFRDRKWQVAGTFVGSIIDPESLDSDPDFVPEKSYGTGGTFDVRKRGGKVRAGMWSRWETGNLDLNDIGFLSSPDEISVGGWMSYSYNPDGTSKVFNRANFNLNLNGSFLYEERTGYDLHTNEELWSYNRGHRGTSNSNINGWMQFRNYWDSWWGLALNPEGSQRWDTRTYVELENGDYASIPGGGPLIDEPWTWGGWWGVGSDHRKKLSANIDLNYYNDEANNESFRFGPGLRWNQSSNMHHNIHASFRRRNDDTQHLANYENPGGGIGGVSYVYGDLYQETFSLTLRSSLLFDRNKSLELYVQPYITIGDYHRARELTRPDSYDLENYDPDGFEINDYDFSFSSVNLNAVYRWEYRPGSTFYFVWSHSRANYDERGFYDDPGQFNNDMEPGTLFDNEPENKFLVKFSYWMPI